MKDREPYSAADHSAFTSNGKPIEVRHITRSVILVGNEGLQLSNEEVKELVRRASSINELLDPDKLYPRYIKYLLTERSFVQGWRMAAYELLREYYQQEKLDEDDIMGIIRGGITNVAKFLQGNNPRKRNIYNPHNFESNLGQDYFDQEQAKSVLMVCPAAGLAIRWYRVADQVISRAEKARNEGKIKFY